MPIEKEVFDEILTLTAKVMVAELRAAVAAGDPIDPRKIKNALDLVERSDPRAFQVKEEPMVLKPVPSPASATDAAPVTEAIVVPDIYKTKSMRDRLRKLGPEYLNQPARQILNSFAAEDSADPIPEPTP